MGILSIFGKGLQAMIDELNTPESFKIGQQFEEYVREYLFVDRYYDLLERTHDYKTNNKDYVHSSLKPDFKFRDKLNKKEFYIEAKFRTGLYNNKIVWCNDNQLKRYRSYNKEKPVFLILGIGETPESINLIALMNIKSAKYTGLFPSYVEQFEINPRKEISSKILWDRERF